MVAVRLGCAPKFDIICETKANACPKITSMPTKRAGRALHLRAHAKPALTPEY